MEPVDVANMALALLEEVPIASLSQEAAAARLINRHYDQTRKAEIAKHLWSFAVSSESVIGVDSGSDGLSWSYAVPDGALRILPLTYDGEPDGIPISWRREGGTIYSDQSSPRTIRYLEDKTDPDEWSPLFTEVMVAALALKVAHPLTHKTNMIQIAQNAYDRALREALRVNAIESAGTLYRQSWATARGDTRYWRA